MANCEVCCVVGDFELQAVPLGAGNNAGVPESKVPNARWKDGLLGGSRWRIPDNLRDSVAVMWSPIMMQ